jgi:excinuclease ABC subunit A
VLTDLIELLMQVCPAGQILWNNKQVVPIYVPEQHEPWAAVQTKKLDAVYLHLLGPKGRFPLGQIARFGQNSSVEGDRPNVDMLHFQFRMLEEIHEPAFKAFLQEHLAAVRGK